MKRIMQLIGVLIILAVLPVLPKADLSGVACSSAIASAKTEAAAEQDEPNTVTSTIEERLLTVEQRLDDHEDRLGQLEDSPPRRTAASRPDSNRPGKDDLRVERTKKQVQAARDAIDVIQAKIDALPSTSGKPLDTQLDIVSDKWRLLADKERNLSKIASLAQRNSDIGVDAVSAKQDLAECQQHKRNADDEKQRLYNQIQDKKRVLPSPKSAATAAAPFFNKKNKL